MLSWAIASLTLLSGPAVVCDGLAALAVDHRSDLETLYAQGKTYVEFRDAATSRVAAWNDHYANAQVPDALRTRVTALPGSWRLLVVAEDWCGDSANTIPYVAKLVNVAVQSRHAHHQLHRRQRHHGGTPDSRRPCCHAHGDLADRGF